MKKQSILVATGQKIIDDTIEKIGKYKVIGRVEYEEDFKSKCLDLKPDVILVGSGLFWKVSVFKTLLSIQKALSDETRIVYLAGQLDANDEHKLNSLALLVMSGIYDIITDKQITVESLVEALDNPKSIEDVEYILSASDRSMSSRKNSQSQVEFITPEEDDEDGDIRRNLHAISSIKPGTGKSFLATNIAAAIAKYGEDTSTGKRPRVALIEADLQNLSLGTLLQIEDDEKNLKTVMDKIGEIVTESGEFIGDESEIRRVNQYIRSCFQPYYKIENLQALVGSQLGMEELRGITDYHYIYLVDAISNYYDVVIVDTNSALTHVTTYPLLHMANNCYYVLNLDFNNVRNNLRYKDILTEMGVESKVKYILNEDVKVIEEDEEELMFDADLLEDSGFRLEARIPVIPKTTFLNRLYEGTPIVLDKRKEMDNVRKEIFKVANQIYPIKSLSL